MSKKSGEKPSGGAVRAPGGDTQVVEGGSAQTADAKPSAAEKQETAKQKPAYVVAKGKSVTSLRGILGPETEVSAKDFPGGEERLRELAEKGVVVKL